ncbi:hypothetical protein ACOMHN_038152 [Nucella lapillus]
MHCEPLYAPSKLASHVRMNTPAPLLHLAGSPTSGALSTGPPAEPVVAQKAALQVRGSGWGHQQAGATSRRPSYWHYIHHQTV